MSRSASSDTPALQDTLSDYRLAFESARQSLNQALLRLHQKANCTPCEAKRVEYEAKGHALFTPSHADCAWDDWRRRALHYLNAVYGKRILGLMTEMKSAQSQVRCKQTGNCCRLASSEFSWAQLQAKASAGDQFAIQFCSVFLPYASLEQAKARFPEVVEDVVAYASRQNTGQQDVYFYHCPYVTEQNLCSLYGTEKRPDICGSYPETALSYIHKQCAWRPWQEEHRPKALLAHASIELGSFYLQEIEAALVAGKA